MADDDWGDDAGDAGGDGGDWGNDDAGGDWGNDDGGQQGGVDEQEQLSIEVKISNLFYEADDARLDQPEKALQMFTEVLELGKQLDAGASEQEFVFKALQRIVELHYQKQDYDKMMKVFSQLLAAIPKQTPDEAQKALNRVLLLASESSDRKFADRVYESTLDTIQKLPNQERLWFRVMMNYCELFYARGDFKSCEEKTDRLLKSCQLPDGSDDPSKGAELLGIYALKTRMSFGTHDNARLKLLYEKTKNLTAAVADPKSQSVIRECWGQMFGHQGQWSTAYTEFFTAFKNYNETGMMQKAKQCLKYMVIANLLSGSEQNPFLINEAKVYQNDPDILAVETLRDAFEKCEVAKFNTALAEITKDKDPFVLENLGDMIRDFQGRAIILIAKSYRRIRVDFLAKALKINTQEVEALLVQLILDGSVVGKIDQLKGILDLTQSGVGGVAKYVAVERWAKTLDHLRGTLPTVAGSSRPEYF